MTQKRVTSRASLALLALLMLTFGWSIPSAAQSDQAPQMAGDWELRKDTPSTTTGELHTALTGALDGRKAHLKVACSPYHIFFQLSPDKDFESAFPESTFEEVALATIGSNTRSVILTRSEDGDFAFTAYVKELMRGATLMICPKNDDKEPACLTFSLKGFTAALKATCPRR